MSIGSGLLEKHNKRSGIALQEPKIKAEFLEEFKSQVGKISKEDANKLEDENYQTELEILMEAGLVEKLKGREKDESKPKGEMGKHGEEAEEEKKKQKASEEDEKELDKLSIKEAEKNESKPNSIEQSFIDGKNPYKEGSQAYKDWNNGMETRRAIANAKTEREKYVEFITRNFALDTEVESVIRKENISALKQFVEDNREKFNPKDYDIYKKSVEEKSEMYLKNEEFNKSMEMNEEQKKVYDSAKKNGKSDEEAEEMAKACGKKEIKKSEENPETTATESAVS